MKHEQDTQPSLGELRWMRVVNGLEDRRAVGKPRPGLVLVPLDGHIRAIGFTTQRTTVDDCVRAPIPNPIAVGLSKPGSVWSPAPVRVSILDVEDHIGWADSDLIELVLKVCRLPIHLRLPLRSYQMSLSCRGGELASALPRPAS